MPKIKTDQKTKASVGPSRVRSARSDASLLRMQATIENTFGLPEGSVKLVGPRRGAKLGDEATIGDLRVAWEPKTK